MARRRFYFSQTTHGVRDGHQAIPTVIRPIADAVVFDQDRIDWLAFYRAEGVPESDLADLDAAFEEAREHYSRLELAHEEQTRGLQTCKKCHESRPLADYVTKDGRQTKKCASCRAAHPGGSSASRKVHLSYAGELLTFQDAEALSGVPATTIAYRIRAGWSVARAVETPVKPRPVPPVKH